MREREGRPQRLGRIGLVVASGLEQSFTLPEKRFKIRNGGNPPARQKYATRSIGDDRGGYAIDLQLREDQGVDLVHLRFRKPDEQFVRRIINLEILTP